MFKFQHEIRYILNEINGCFGCCFYTFYHENEPLFPIIRFSYILQKPIVIRLIVDDVTA